MNDKKTGGTRTFLKVLLPILLPIAGRNIINSSVSVADVLMLGRVGEVALSGAAFGGQVFLIITLILSGLTGGASILISQYWGRGARETVERVLAIALQFSFVLGVVFFLGTLLAPELILRIFTPDPQIIAAGADYLRHISPAFLIASFTEVYYGALCATNRVLISTVSKFTALLVNLTLNALLIFGWLGAPRLGLRGAAIATALARGVELIIAVCYALRHRELRIRLDLLFRPHGVLLRDFLRYAVPTTMNDLLWVLGSSMTSVIIGHLGASVTAANSVAYQVREFMLVFSYGMASASAILIGKTLGSGDMKLAEDYGRRLMATASLIGLGAGLLVFLSCPVMLRIVNLGGVSREYLRYLLHIMPFFAVLQAFTTLVNLGIFRAGGDPTFALILDFLTMWGINVGLGMLSAFVFHWPVKITLLIILSDELVKAPILYRRYRKKIWVRNITREEMLSPVKSS